MLLTTRDKNGNTPDLTQLPSNSPQALIDIIRSDAALFSGATGVPLNSMGIVQDNPSSADAIETMRKDITDEAERAKAQEQRIRALKSVGGSAWM